MGYIDRFINGFWNIRENKFEFINFTPEEIEMLIYFFGKRGAKELDVFVNSNEQIFYPIGYNTDLMHNVNSFQFSDPEMQRKINNLHETLTTKGLSLAYYDNGLGEGDLLIISKSTC